MPAGGRGESDDGLHPADAGLYGRLRPGGPIHDPEQRAYEIGLRAVRGHLHSMRGGMPEPVPREGTSGRSIAAD